MRAAPAVQVVLSAGRSERMLITLLHALAGALLTAWLALHCELQLASWSVLVGMLAATCLMAALGEGLARRALPPAAGWLRWDGQAWSCVNGRSRPLQRLVVALDLGLWVLLRLYPADGSRALWRVASARTARADWHGLRVALATHAGTAAPAADGRSP